MKQPAAALISLMLLCTACARGTDRMADSAGPATETDAVPEETTGPDAIGSDSGNASATQPSAATRVGIIHRIRMTSDSEGFRFDPPELALAVGEAITFIVVEGGPHNVVFDGQSLASDIQTRLDQQISDRSAPLTSGMLSESGEAVTVSFAGMPAGRYPFSCATHGASGMRGTVIVQ